MHKLALILILSAAALSAQAQTPADSGFHATVGVAGFDTSVELGSSDEQAIISVGYRFDERLSLDLAAPVEPFTSHFDQAGFGRLISTDFRPYTLTLNYALRPQKAFNPFVGVGYSRISVDPEAVGVLAGLDLNAKAASGYVVRLGADYRINDHWFVRGDASATRSNLTIYANTGTNSSKIVDEDMDPVTYSLSVGYRF